MYLCMKEPYLQVSGTDALSGTGGKWHLVGRETIEEGKNTIGDGGSTAL